MSAVPPFTGINLLRFKPVHGLVRWAGFPYVFQGVMLVVLVALGVASWQQYAPDGVADGLYARTNIVQLLIWGLWWPAMIWAAVLLGRAWCMVCPLELVANVSERLSRLVGIQQRVLGRWLRSGFAIVVLYAVIQMLVAGIHPTPRARLYIVLPVRFDRFGGDCRIALQGSSLLPRVLSGRIVAGDVRTRGDAGGAARVNPAVRRLHEPRLCVGMSSRALAGPKLPQSP